MFSWSGFGRFAGVVAGMWILIFVAARLLQPPGPSAPAEQGGLLATSGADSVRLLVLQNVCIIAEPALPTPAVVTPHPVPCRALIYNPVMIRGWPEALVLFTFLHEYSHLVLQHPPAQDLSSEERKQLEREADCRAAQRFAEYWPEKVEALIRQVAAVLPGGEHHDPGEARARLIAGCIRG